MSRLATSLFFGRRPTPPQKKRSPNSTVLSDLNLEVAILESKISAIFCRNFRNRTIGFFYDLTHLRRAGFRHENRIFFSALRHLAEILKGFFFNFKVFKPEKKDFLNPKKSIKSYLKSGSVFNENMKSRLKFNIQLSKTFFC